MAATTARAGRGSSMALLTLAPFFWSINWIVGRGLADDVPPLAMTFYRWLFAIGVVGVGIHNSLAYLGLHYTTAVNGVILNSFIPVMIVALSWLVLRERLSPAGLAGVAISLCGVLTILSRGSLSALLAFRLNAGDLLIVLSMAMWSLYTIGLRWRPPGMRMLSFLFAIAGIALFSSVLAYVFRSRGVERLGASVAGLF